MPKTTTITLSDSLSDLLAEEGKRLGGVGWTRMAVIALTQWAEQVKKARSQKQKLGG